MRNLIVFLMLFAFGVVFMPNETKAFDNDVGIEMPVEIETQAVIKFDLNLSEDRQIIEWYSQPVKEKKFYLIPLSAEFTHRYDKPPNTLGKKIYIKTKDKLPNRESYTNLGYSKVH
jgi:hypothetical protein